MTARIESWNALTNPNSVEVRVIGTISEVLALAPSLAASGGLPVNAYPTDVPDCKLALKATPAYPAGAWYGFVGTLTGAQFAAISTSHLAAGATVSVWGTSLSQCVWNGAAWSAIESGGSIFVSTPSTTIYVDCNRSDSYAADGTYTFPFKTLAAALAVVTGPTAIHMAPGAYTGSMSAYPAFPLTVYGNGSTLTLSAAVTLTKDYTAYDLNVVAPLGITYAGVASTTRFILRNGSRRGPMNVSSGLLDALCCTQTWSATADKMVVSGTGQLLECLCINTLPILQNGAGSMAIIEECMWNTARASTDLIESSAGQLSVLNTTVVNSSATAGGGIYIHNAQTSSAPNVLSGVMAQGVNAIRVATGATLYSKCAPAGALDLAACIGVPDLKQFTAEPFTPISAGLTISASTPDALFLAASYPITLAAVYIAKVLKVASSSAYTIVIPTGVQLLYNGQAYTAVTKTVPLGYLMEFDQVSETVWIARGNATLS